MNWGLFVSDARSRRAVLTLAVLGAGMLASAGTLAWSMWTGFALEEAFKQRMSELDRSRRAIQEIQWPNAAEQRQWEEAEAQVRHKILTGRDFPSLLNEMSALASGFPEVRVAVLTPDQFKLLAKSSVAPSAPAPEPPSGWGERRYVKISFQADYDDLRELFARLSRVNRLIEIESFSVTRNPPSLSVELVLQITSIEAKDHAF